MSDDYTDILRTDSVPAAKVLELLRGKDAELARLRAENAKYLTALEKIAKSDSDGGWDSDAPDMWKFCRETARSALEE